MRMLMSAAALAAALCVSPAYGDKTTTRLPPVPARTAILSAETVVPVQATVSVQTAVQAAPAPAATVPATGEGVGTQAAMSVDIYPIAEGFDYYCEPASARPLASAGKTIVGTIVGTVADTIGGTVSRSRVVLRRQVLAQQAARLARTKLRLDVRARHIRAEAAALGQCGGCEAALTQKLARFDERVQAYWADVARHRAAVAAYEQMVEALD